MQSKILSCITLIILSIYMPLMAQEVSSTWGIVSTADLEMENYEAAPDATAVVLIDKGHYEVKGREFFTMTYHKRTKILKTAGFEEGDVAIHYNSKNKYEKIKTIKAQVILPDGTKIVVPTADFFDEKISDNWSAKKFTFPQLKVGAIIEYEYVLISKSLTTLKTWYFQGEHPVRESELVISLPPYSRYNFSHQGIPLTEQWLNGKKNNVNDVLSEFQLYKSGERNQYRFVARNMEGLTEPAFITTMSDFYTKMKFLISQAPNQTYTGAYFSWPKIVNHLIEDEDFGWQYRYERYTKGLIKNLKPILKSTEDKEAQLELVYNYLSEHIKIINKPGLYLEKSLNNSFKAKLASAEELNLMMVAAVNHLKIGKARPALISTLSNGETDVRYPYLSQFDRILAYVTLENRELLIDLANPYLPMGYTDLDALTNVGLVIEDIAKDEAKWVTIKPMQSTEIFVGDFELNEKGILAGKVDMQYRGYTAARMRANLESATPKETWEEEFENRHPNIESSDFILKDESDRNVPLTLSATCSFPDAIQAMDDIIYINPILHSTIKENPFKDKERKIDITFPYPIKQKQVIKINIPEGYEVEELPTAQHFKLGNDGSYIFQITEEKRVIRIASIFDLKKSQFPKENYQALKNLFDLMIEKMGEQIVLKKKADLAKNN